MTEELNKAREELKILEREVEEKSRISKSINAASLVLEKHYREICRKNNIDDVLKIIHDKDKPEVELKDFDPTQKKPVVRKKEDRRVKNPIWRAMYPLVTQQRTEDPRKGEPARRPERDRKPKLQRRECRKAQRNVASSPGRTRRDDSDDEEVRPGDEAEAQRDRAARDADKR